MAGIAAHSPTGRFATDALVSPSDSPYAAHFAGEPNIKELATIALDASVMGGALRIENTHEGWRYPVAARVQ